MAIDRTKYNALVDDDGTNTTGSVWNKTAIKEVILDPVDAAISSSGVTLPISLTTQVTGTLQAAQEPAHTGDVTNSAGSLALTIASNAVTSAKIASAAVTNAKLANPVTVVMTDGATISLDASQRAPIYQVTTAGDRTISAPNLPVDGQKIIIRHIAGGGANRTLTLASGAQGFRFGSDITGLTATVSGKADYIGCIYNGTDLRWDIVAVAKGF